MCTILVHEICTNWCDCPLFVLLAMLSSADALYKVYVTYMLMLKVKLSTWYIIHGS